MPDRVRESLFNVLSETVADHPFLDLFSGTGAVGIEALSRGASTVEFVERDPRAVAAILRHLHEFGVAAIAHVHRADVYRWAERWQGGAEACTVFLGPPYADLERRPADLMLIVAGFQERLASGSLVVLQSDKSFDIQNLPQAATWKHRTYGRNRLSFWTKE